MPLSCFDIWSTMLLGAWTADGEMLGSIDLVDSKYAPFSATWSMFGGLLSSLYPLGFMARFPSRNDNNGRLDSLGIGGFYCCWVSLSFGESDSLHWCSFLFSWADIYRLLWFVGITLAISPAKPVLEIKLAWEQPPTSFFSMFWLSPSWLDTIY